MLTIAEILDLGRRRHQQGDLAGAEAHYRHALQADPGHVQALHLLGILANQTGRREEGVLLLRKAIALDPRLPELHSHLGIALADQGQSDQAAESYRAALRLDANHKDALNNLGNILAGKGQLAEAEECFRAALAAHPNDAGIHYNLGNALLRQGRSGPAIESYRQVLLIDGGHADAHNNLANALLAQGQLAEAAETFRGTLRLNPGHENAHFNLGCILFGEGQLTQACQCFQEALRLNPSNASAHLNQGIVHFELGDVAEAIGSFRRALGLQPDWAAARSRLLFTLLFLPDCEPHALFEEHRLWNLRHAEPLTRVIQVHDNDPSPGRRLRLGYVSPNFRDHALTFFTLPLLAAHDKNAFEIFCYADVARPDDLTARIRSHAAVWRDITGRDDEQVAELIRQDQIDILVDLTMHMADNRLLVFARKPAPVQVCWLAYQGTTGLDAIDYRLTDAQVDPPGMFDRFYSEKSVRLPGAFGCYDPLCEIPPVKPPPVLKHGAITFGSLNNIWKTNPPLLRLWASVLKAVESSRMIILAYEGPARRHILEIFGQEGVAVERVHFVEGAPRARYLERYHDFDIALDTLPYNGQTTSLDALWMGVPVITMAGQTAVGRAGLSLLQNLGLPELIAQTPAQFVAIAVELTRDSQRLSDLRMTMRERLRRSSLMDAPLFARNMEAAYRGMWQDWCNKRKRN